MGGGCCSSSSHWPTVCRLAAKQRLDDARISVSQCDCGAVESAALDQVSQPSALRVALVAEPSQDRSRTMDQQRPQVRVAAFADARQPRATTGRMLPRHQTQPGRQMPAVLELPRVTHRRPTAVAVRGPTPSMAPILRHRSELDISCFTCASAFSMSSSMISSCSSDSTRRLRQTSEISPSDAARTAGMARWKGCRRLSDDDTAVGRHRPP